ncbi:MAG: MraY family glycosyltransferase [Parcubacteria group bacterium]|jgi:UDP-GlcNAc:undecaprenyl-phosphate GlcNAc-1-phosphate transferase
MIKYLIPFLASFLTTALLIVAGIYFGKRIKWDGRTSSRHIHRPGALRIGGVAMIVAFNLTILLNSDLVITEELVGVMLASLILLLVGIWDDLREIFWKTQFFYQVAIATLVFIFGVRIYYVTNPLTGGILQLDSGLGMIFSVALVLIWIILMINSMNWIDGIDGLSGGITLIGALTIFVLSLKPEVNQPPMAILSMILAGTALGFLVFNFYPSFVLAGTSGATFMGFALAVMAIFAGTKVATAILVMAIPVADFLWVIGERLKNKQSIFKADRNHLHHKLLSLGWSQRKTALYFYAITISISIIALNTRFIGKTVTLLLAAIVLSISLVVISKKIKKSDYV